MAFGLVFRQAGEDYLSDLRTVDTWLHTAPKREPHLILEAAIELLRTDAEREPNVKPKRLAAVLSLEARLHPILEALTRDHVDSPSLPRSVHTRMWYLQYDLAESFIAVYERFIAAARSGIGARDLGDRLPMLLARTLRHLYEQARLRLFRHEQWIPAKLHALHRVYRMAADAGATRVTVSLPGRAQIPSDTTVEHEYLQCLALLRLSSGNMTARQIAIASDFLRMWAGGLALESRRPGRPAFEIDPGSGHGLRPQTGVASHAEVLYWDPAPLLDAIRRELGKLGDLQRAPASEVAFRREQAEVLKQLLHFWSPDDITHRDDRHPALAEALPVVVGFNAICNVLEYAAYKQRIPFPGQDQSQTYQYSVVGLAGSYLAGDVRDGTDVVNGRSPKLEHVDEWRLLDRSESGYRLAAPISNGVTLPMGTLILLVVSYDERVIALIRRVKKNSSTQAEYGLERLGSDTQLVGLRVPSQAWLAADRAAARDSGLGPPVSALLLRNGSRSSDFREHSLILPPSEFVPGAARCIAAPASLSLVRLKIALAGGEGWIWTGYDEIRTMPA